MDWYSDLCSKDAANGNLKVEWAVFTSFHKVAGIPEDASASAFLPDCRTFASIKLTRKVLHIPPDESKKNSRTLVFWTLSIIASNAIFWSATNFGIDNFWVDK